MNSKTDKRVAAWGESISSKDGTALTASQESFPFFFASLSLRASHLLQTHRHTTHTYWSAAAPCLSSAGYSTNSWWALWSLLTGLNAANPKSEHIYFQAWTSQLIESEVSN